METITVPEPTIEEAYNKIVEYFSQPGAELARDTEENRCMYRTADGRKCAVGCLIPDDAYKSTWEGYSAEVVCKSLDWKNPYLFYFLKDAQAAHDKSEYPSEFLAKLKKTYRKYNKAK